MDIFVPPGYMTLGDLVERTGQALFKDEWLGAAAVAAELAHRQEVADLVQLSRSRPYGRLVPSLGEIATMASARRDENQRMREQYGHVIATLRVALCDDALRGGQLLLSGQIEKAPPWFWRGRAAEAVFLSETPWVNLEPEPQGDLLFLRAEAEAWLAKQGRPAHQERSEDVIAARGVVLSESRAEVLGLMSGDGQEPPAPAEPILSENQVTAYLDQRAKEHPTRRRWQGQKAMWHACKAALGGSFPRERFVEMYKDAMHRHQIDQPKSGRPSRAANCPE
jgi:hypothetical protein